MPSAGWAHDRRWGLQTRPGTHQRIRQRETRSAGTAPPPAAVDRRRAHVSTAAMIVTTASLATEYWARRRLAENTRQAPASAPTWWTAGAPPSSTSISSCAAGSRLTSRDHWPRVAAPPDGARRVLSPRTRHRVLRRAAGPRPQDATAKIAVRGAVPDHRSGRRRWECAPKGGHARARPRAGEAARSDERRIESIDGHDILRRRLASPVCLVLRCVARQ